VNTGLPIRLAVVAAAGAVVVAGAAGVVAPTVGAGVWYPLKAALTFALVMVVAAVASRHLSSPRLGPANVVTSIRAMGVALVTGLIGEPASATVAWTVVGACSTIAALDGVDGWLARRTQMASPFGARFDMETDALLILVVSILVWQHGKAGAWVIAGGAMRYAFVAAGAGWPWLARPLRSTFRGKIVAVTFIVGLLVALAPIVPWPASAGAAAIVLALLAWSFAVDIRWLHGRRVMEGGWP
jgi:phosphatidylglycerophosphate synthase